MHSCEELVVEIQRQGFNQKQALPRVPANLVDNFSDEGNFFSNASDMIKTQLTSLGKREGNLKWYVDNRATKHVSPNQKKHFNLLKFCRCLALLRILFE
jgi:hypothetical protein